MKSKATSSGKNKRAALLLDAVLDSPAETLQAKMFQGLRELIIQGVLPPDAKIPSTRRLAEDLGVSRNTVVAALEKLASDGWLEMRQGSGTYVAARPPLRSPRSLQSLPDRQGDVPFTPNVPGLDLFPAEIWNRLQSRRWRTMPRSALQEGDHAGWAGLRSIIPRHLHLTRGIECEPQQVFITNGARAATYLATRVLTQPGDQVWVEDPGYFGTKNIMRAQALAVASVPVDREGLSVMKGMELAPDAKLAIVTSHCQFPSGVAMSELRQAELRQWAERAGGWIIDDGYDSEFNFGPGRLTSISQGARDRVLYVNSFNKSLFPALRIGYVVVPPSLVDTFSGMRGVLDGQSNVPNQMVLHDFLEGGHYDEHIRRCREAYAERRAALLAALGGPLSEWLEAAPHKAGLHVVTSVRKGGSAKPLVDNARDAGIDLTPMTQFSERAFAENQILLGFSGFSPATLAASAVKLARVCADTLSGPVQR